MKRSKFWKYFREYEWAQIFAMIRNNQRAPLICDEHCSDKLVVITGATSGIGYVTAIKYASMGARLLCINRNPRKSELLKHEIEKSYGTPIDYITADLSKIADIKKAANELLQLAMPIDILIHNAGVYLTRQELTEDGLDKVFVVHYLSTFIFNHILMPKLKQQSAARIILVNSEGHRFAAWGIQLDDLNWKKRKYSGLGSYGSAKTAQLLSMLVFDEQFQKSNVTVNAMHPGAVKTDTGQENGPVYRWFKKNLFDKTLKSADVSAEALYYLGVSRKLDKISGKFFNLTTDEIPAPPALDLEEARLLWIKSIELASLKDKLDSGALKLK